MPTPTISSPEIAAFVRAFVARYKCAFGDTDVSTYLISQLVDQSLRGLDHETAERRADLRGAIQDGLLAAIIVRNRLARQSPKVDRVPSKRRMPEGWEYVDLESHPASAGGSDWGVARPILIRKGKKQLWAWPGRSSHKDGYRPFTLHLLDYSGMSRHRSSFGDEVLEGRMTSAAMDKAMPRIIEFFGEPKLSRDHIVRQKTLVIPETAGAPVGGA